MCINESNLIEISNLNQKVGRLKGELEYNKRIIANLIDILEHNKDLINIDYIKGYLKNI